LTLGKQHTFAILVNFEVTRFTTMTCTFRGGCSGCHKRAVRTASWAC